MSRDPLIYYIKTSIEDAKMKGGKETLREELASRISSLDSRDSQVVTNLIDVIDRLRDDKGMIIELIKTTIVIVERIKGRNQGPVKKQEALEIFTAVINCVGVSQRDRKVYLSVFDNTIELAFWGRDWLKSGGWERFKNFISTHLHFCG